MPPLRQLREELDETGAALAAARVSLDESRREAAAAEEVCTCAYQLRLICGGRPRPKRCAGEDCAMEPC